MILQQESVQIFSHTPQPKTSLPYHPTHPGHHPPATKHRHLFRHHHEPLAARSHRQRVKVGVISTLVRSVWTLTCFKPFVIIQQIYSFFHSYFSLFFLFIHHLSPKFLLPVSSHNILSLYSCSPCHHTSLNFFFVSLSFSLSLLIS